MWGPVLAAGQLFASLAECYYCAAAATCSIKSAALFDISSPRQKAFRADTVLQKGLEAAFTALTEHLV